MILVNITGLLMIEETMISPQEPSNGMSNEEYARVMTGEKYWREHIAKEIENYFDGNDDSVSLQETIMDCAAIARGQK